MVTGLNRIWLAPLGKAAVSSAIATCHFFLGIASTSSAGKEGHVIA